MEINQETIGGGRNRPVERLRGMDDQLPPAVYRTRRVLDYLAYVAEVYGYQPVDVPLLESTELFLRKSGESLAPKLYAFDFRGRPTCIRPEFTASVGRLYVEQLQDAPLPQRLYYAGPVLRHEKPQRGRRRQFTQFGLELIGAEGPLADAEVISAAWDGLHMIGLTKFRVILGHIGATLEMLAHLKLDRRARDFLLINLENLSRPDRGQEYVERRLAELFPATAGPKPTDLASQTGQEAIRWAIAPLLDQLAEDMALGSRSKDEILQSVLDQLARPNQEPLIRQALALVEELHQLAGPPAHTLPAAAELLRQHHLSEEPLRELQEITRLLKAAGIPENELTVDLGFGRGLHYYTGMVFEIYGADDCAGDQPLCGGGRYDDLITSLGGRKKTPACGFAFHVSRLVDCLPEMREEEPRVDVLIYSAGDELAGAALRLAREMRQVGLCVELDVRQRTNRANAQHAAKRGIRYTVEVFGNLKKTKCKIYDRSMRRGAELDEKAVIDWFISPGRRENDEE